MFGFFRGNQPPAAQRPALDRDERILTWASTSTEGVVVATNRGLRLPGRDRLGWHEILKAVWSGRELTVIAGRVAEERDGYTVVVDEPAISTLLLEPGHVPHQVQVRVTKSVAITHHHDLPGGGARVAARRVSGVDGLRWTVRYDPGTPPDAERVDALVARARADAEAAAPR
ncbi:hypothetical protein J2S43_000130 [Catenuloplanes nepalensis]|uniref:Uncharacterized protein n=1 Tax=Catenuloplanes nepalensis TaxID=587533 RepID=A0ABT9MJM1_9ACTN|nr:hypothetical protein [Catenuloplanes nepalensis]MDP9791618.1 hypothetical protein [Catenuloplanes nepalensis]